MGWGEGDEGEQWLWEGLWEEISSLERLGWAWGQGLACQLPEGQAHLMTPPPCPDRCEKQRQAHKAHSQGPVFCQTPYTSPHQRQPCTRTQH